MIATRGEATTILALVANYLGRRPPMPKEDWKPCQISPEALIRLKLAATLTGREQRELATQAVITFCTAILTRKLGKDVNHEHLAVALDETLKLKKKKKL
jgi:hypothetical protein